MSPGRQIIDLLPRTLIRMPQVFPLADRPLRMLIHTLQVFLLADRLIRMPIHTLQVFPLVDRPPRMLKQVPPYCSIQINLKVP